MTGKEAGRRILAALGEATRRQWGQIGKKEAEVARSRGYLGKAARGAFKMPLEALLDALDAFGLEPAAFFGEALDVVADPDLFLAGVAGREPPPKGFAALARALEELPGGGGVPSSAEPTSEDRTLAAELAATPPARQRRRLLGARRYRRPAFAAAYLERLDDLRYEHPRKAARLASTVVTGLAPRLEGPSGTRRIVQCRALGVYGSAMRLDGRTALAARSIRLALTAARRAGAAEVTAELLQRGAYVLSDAGHYRRGTALLREALGVWVERGLDLGLGKTLVDRGILLRWAGEAGPAVRVLSRALEVLPAAGPSCGRNREAVYHHLIQAHLAAGDGTAAEDAWRRARRDLGGEGDAGATRLAWQRGRIHLARGETQPALAELRRARRRLERRGDPESVLVTFDLLGALFAAGRGPEARSLARQEAPRLAAWRGRPATASALAEVARAALHGGLDAALVERLAASTHRGGEVPGSPLS